MSDSTTTAAKLLTFLEVVLKPSSYATVGETSKGAAADIIGVLVQRQWIETLVIALEKLVTLSVSFL